MDAGQPQAVGLRQSVSALELLSLGRPEKAVLPCQLFHMGEVCSVLCGRGESSWGVRMSGCQRTAGVTDCLGSKQQVLC